MTDNETGRPGSGGGAPTFIKGADASRLPQTTAVMDGFLNV